MSGAIRRAAVRLVAALLLLTIVAGLPAALVAFIGWPLPRTVPSADDLRGWLTSPLSDLVIVRALAIAAWLLWAAFLPSIVAEARAARQGLPTVATTGATANPLRLAAAALITAITLGSMPAFATEAPAAAANTRVIAAAAVTAQTRGPATIHVDSRSYSYVVERSDTLSGIAAAWLGHADRWPEICRLNWHRHWPAVGGRLTDCNLIYPGWELRLPADARQPDAATPTPPPTPGHPGASPTPPSNDAPPPPEPTGQEPSTGSATSGGPGTPAPEPTGTGSIAPGPVETSGPTGHAVPSTSLATPSPAETTPSSVAAPASSPTSDEHGITLPGSFIPWTLATSITAAVALVWLQRRRRHTPDTTDDDPRDLPELILHVSREVIRRPDLPADPDLAERAAQVPGPVPLPPGGLGLVGAGAAGAARAVLAEVLSSGGPRDPDRQGEVIIDGSTLTTLIGADAAGLGPWPRLHVADDLEHALALIEARLLQRARLLDEHALTDLSALRDQAPDEEPVPPVVLITETPPPGARMRVKAALALGADLEIMAILLGEWPHGVTAQVEDDGRAHPLDPDTGDGVTSRLGVLDIDTAVAVLATLREAHTGARPRIAISPGDQGDAPEEAHSRASSVTSPDMVSSGSAGTSEPPAIDSPPLAPKAQLRVFGTPHVEGVTDPGQPLRAKAAELAVFLACHPDGADTRSIGEHLERGVRMRAADVRVHTNVSNLRHVMGRAAGPRKIGYVVKGGGQYRLDPATVDVDLWQLRRLTKRAATAAGTERIRLLRDACDLYTAPLADGCDYDWVEPYREKGRQDAAEAHLLLADALLYANDPQAAADLLDRAISLDRYNEALYRKAMQARHALGDHAEVRALLHALNVALADLDAEPDQETFDLADRLRSSPDARSTREGGG
jgi:DNA-binding SARP family transcriptional activator